MTDESAIIAAICDRPDDDTPRLVYADWLDDHDRPERAAVIREQVRHAIPTGNGDTGHGGRWLCADGGPAAWPQTVTRPLGWWNVHACRPLKRLGLTQPVNAWLPPAPTAATADYARVEFRRGFPAEVECPAAWWVGHGDALNWHPAEARPCPVTASPGLTVRLTALDVQEDDNVFFEHGERLTRFRVAPGEGAESFVVLRRRVAGLAGVKPPGAAESITAALRARWPGVRAWHLPPPARTHQYSHWELEVARYEALIANALLYGRPEHELRSFLGPPGG